MIIEKLNTFKDVLFDRPSTDLKYLARLCVSEANINNDQNNYQAIWFQDREVLSFGELLSAYIDLNKLTLKEFKQQIQVELDELYAILDDEKLPWELDLSLHQRILVVCDFNKDLFTNTIKRQKLNYDNYLAGTKNMSVAARADTDLDDEERKEQISIAKNKLFEDRAERRKESFLIQYQML
jgi:hypothetical protein